MAKILAFDIGISSIGWAFVENDELKDCGVRIFTKAENPKTGESLALPRRLARSARKRLARRKARLNHLKHLIANEFKLNYEDYQSFDESLAKAYKGTLISPYELRFKALNELLSKQDLARVILHIAKRRGYDNIKNSDDKEKGAILKAVKENEEKLANYKSVGEYLYKEYFQKFKENSKEFINVRNKKESYERCIAQSFLKDELKLIFQKQREFGFNFSKKFEEEVLSVAFYKRALKDFSHLVGNCSFFVDEKRAPKNSPLAFEFVALTRIVNLLNNLNKNNSYIKDDLNALLSEVLKNGTLTYKQTKKILGLSDDYEFKGQKGNYFIEFKKYKEFIKALGEHNLNQDDLNEIAKDITLVKDETKLKKALAKYDLNQNQIENLSKIEFKDHLNISFKALKLIVPLMREGKKYDEVCNELNLKTAINEDKKEFLPAFNETYYKDEVNNPVVLRAIKEYRKVLNSLLKKYGKVHKINIELAREVGKNHRERSKIEKEQNENFKAKKDAELECEKLGLKINSKNILKLRLFKEQKEFCVYSGEKIKISDLQDEKILEIDHIYPYSRSFDDSYMNKVLVFTKQNQEKLNKTPFEAFGKDDVKWQKIETLAKNLPAKKQKRILDKNYKDKEQKDFKDRNLNDTRYIARLVLNYTKDYLEFLPLSDDENIKLNDTQKGSKVHVEAKSGMLTSVLRHTWGFSTKDRNNHLHHAIDAVIIAYANASVVKAFSDFKKEQENYTAELYAKKINELDFKNKRKFFEPFSNFRQKVLEKIDEIFVSKPERKKPSGALHEETFYKEEEFYKEYGGKEGVLKALELGKIRKVNGKIVSNANMFRVDIFKYKKTNKFYAVPIYTMDFALGILPNKAVVGGKDKQGIIKDWLLMDENYEFCFSLYKDSLILLQTKDMQEPELVYFKSFKSSTAGLVVSKHDNKFENLNENQKKLFKSANEKKVVAEGIGIQNLKVFEKYIVSALGEITKAEIKERENFKKK
ncbi:TPA: type II CRISPR RNA-guided endonuclease Cas9 [Campylobacter jejuni]|nr:type II CRISPR RNA-guided endonuclease Cas9 [Campylobacter jejuni]HDZ4939756.1 type II CRISPR RNA-guided endonuclease Cas9 [Campylobacter jejuni]HDZ4944402.1 type II CRISPR RNA-guided endonuclease Cas9 [Campylobacter jejuni]HDZ4953826.1 type II CRISPR RNA-guided endonuclease Cas9 [Campylobacter jejuni]HDZ4966186.1 type II CRISPR RNA-guided endonuclease Cas9 [Campylobacter jejuni]